MGLQGIECVLLPLKGKQPDFMDEICFTKQISRRAEDVYKRQEHEKLPSENILCEQYGISRTTVRKTFDALAASKYIYKIQGKGTYVAVSYTHLEIPGGAV